MKKGLLFLLVIIITLSCGKEKTISDELVGEWFYERETFNSFSSFEDPDTQGIITLNEDETGNWSTSAGFLNFDLEWDLQSNDSKIAITKSVLGQLNIFPYTTIYDLKRTDENYYTLTYHFKTESSIDTLEGFEQFENIIITRMK
jgi:hypothetical protein